MTWDIPIILILVFIFLYMCGSINGLRKINAENRKEIDELKHDLNQYIEIATYETNRSVGMENDAD